MWRRFGPPAAPPRQERERERGRKGRWCGPETAAAASGGGSDAVACGGCEYGAWWRRLRWPGDGGQVPRSTRARRCLWPGTRQSRRPWKLEWMASSLTSHGRNRDATRHARRHRSQVQPLLLTLERAPRPAAAFAAWSVGISSADQGVVGNPGGLAWNLSWRLERHSTGE